MKDKKSRLQIKEHQRILGFMFRKLTQAQAMLASVRTVKPPGHKANARKQRTLLKFSKMARRMRLKRLIFVVFSPGVYTVEK